jgi:hypothetical protein
LAIAMENQALIAHGSSGGRCTGDFILFENTYKKGNMITRTR